MKEFPNCINRDTLVVTATLGERASLKKTIDSVRNYGGDRVCHVIIAPNDKCESLATLYPSVHVLPEPLDCKGIYFALNYVFKMYGENFKFITFINDDDFWLPSFSELFSVLDINDDIDVVYGRVKFVDANGDFIGEQTSTSRYRSFKILLQNKIVIITQQATLMRSRVFFRVGGFDTDYKLIADTKFWLKAIDISFRFYYCNKLVSGYTVQRGQLSSNGTLQKIEHNLLRNEFEFSSGNRNPFLEKILFRLSNLNIYISRFLKHKGLFRMGSFFHN